MPKIECWDNLPEGVRQHLIDRMRDRAISIADLNQLRVWIEGYVDHIFVQKPTLEAPPVDGLHNPVQ